MRTLKHPFDWFGHLIFFFLMALLMSPLWAVALSAILLEVDQYWTWRGNGWSWLDCFIDLAFDAAGIYLAVWLL